MKTEEYLHILMMTAQIQKKGCGMEGYPAVSVDISNGWKNAEMNIRIKDDGDQQRFYDGVYEFPLNEPTSRRHYEDCVKHLEELIEKTKSFGE